ncbi:MAG: PIN domain nuclease [Mariprofundus sp.]|nr:PIN domain nuclease [Mariprofundus sp.]
MYLVDTSVWIGLFRQQDTVAVRRLRAMLEQNIPYGISSVIYQELLQGAKNEADYQQLQDYLGSQHFYHPTDEIQSYANAARIYFDCRRKGLTIRSTIDCLIAEIAIEHNIVLLHDDADFLHIAKVIVELKECSA